MREQDKTVARLRREIAYFCGVAARTASRDRVERAHRAIRLREQALTEALRRMTPPPSRAHV